jgi:hypothetical protein
MDRQMPRRPTMRRRVVVGVLALCALAEAALAVAVYASQGESRAAAATPSETALPLHPVAGNFRPDDTTLLDCSDDGCFGQAFGNIAYREGPKVALELFDRRIEETGDHHSCHRIAHTIGSASLARYKGDVARTFAEGSSSCFSGYYHGVLERSLANVRSYEVGPLSKIARGLCAGLPRDEESWLVLNCLHGLGHGLMISTGYSLPLALDVCRRLQTEMDRMACKGGTFMENLSTSYGVRSPWLRDDDPVYPCNAVAKRDKLRCYEYVTSRILRVIDWNWDATARMCTELEREWVDACFRSFGRDASSTTRFDVSETITQCSVARRYGGERTCLAGAAIAMTGAYAGTEQSGELCNSTSPAYRGNCWYSVGSVARHFHGNPAQREANCRSITSNAADAAQCIRGTKVKHQRFLDA